jgi:hypothetical protein
MCDLIPLVTHMVFLEVIHVFPQLRGRGVLGKKRASVHLGKPKLLEEYLSKTNSIFPGKKGAICLSFNIYSFLWSDTCVSSTLLNRHIWNKEILSAP